MLLQYSIRKHTRQIIAFKSHNTLFIRTETEKINAAIPYGLVINDCTFLMKATFTDHLNVGIFQCVYVFFGQTDVFTEEVIRRTGHHVYLNASLEFFRKNRQKLLYAVFSHKGRYDQYLLCGVFQILQIDGIKAFAVVDNIRRRGETRICFHLIADGGIAFQPLLIHPL